MRDRAFKDVQGAVLIAGLAVVALFGAMGEKKTLVGRWTVQVLDERGQPLRGIRVSELCNDYDIGWTGGGDLITNARGVVSFPAHVIDARRMFWLLAPLKNRVVYGAHASRGTVASISATDPTIKSYTVHCRDAECRPAKDSVLRVGFRSERLR